MAIFAYLYIKALPLQENRIEYVGVLVLGALLSAQTTILPSHHWLL